MLWVRDRIYLRMPWMRSLVHMSSIFQSLVHAFGPHLSNQFKSSRNDILTLSHTGQTWSNTTNNVLNKPDLKVSTPFIFPSVDAALPPWSTTAWPGKWQHKKGFWTILQYSSMSDDISMYFIYFRLPCRTKSLAALHLIRCSQMLPRLPRFIHFLTLLIFLVS